MLKYVIYLGNAVTGPEICPECVVCVWGTRDRKEKDN